MRVLVTGGTGFTGSHLVQRLLDDGHEVRVLDYKEGLFHDRLVRHGAKVHLGCVTDRDSINAVIKDCEIVYHLAAAFRELGVPKKHYWNVNVEGTRNVAAASLDFGVRRLVYCSTQGVHGHIKNKPGNENAPIAPEDYYQHTKYEGESVVNEYVEKGLDAITLRPTAIYGPGDPARFLMLFKMVKTGCFYMFGRGTTCYHPVHITNLVDAFVLAAESRAETTGEAYIIADTRYWSLNELVNHVARAMRVTVRIKHLPFWPLYGAASACELACKPLGMAPPLFRRRVNWFRQDRAFSIDKARRHLGYAPRIEIGDGLAETASWYLEHGYI